MRTIDIGIGHDDDLVVAQFLDIKLIPANPGAHRRNQRTNFLTAEHPVKTRAFDVQDLAAQG